MFQFTVSRSLTLLCLIALTACGGGHAPEANPGPETGLEVQVVDADNADTFSYASPAGFAPALSPLAGYPRSGAEAELLAAVNAERARGGSCPQEGGGRQTFGAVRPLSFEGHLHQSATVYGRQLAASGTLALAHRGPDGSTPARRMVAAGYVPAPPHGTALLFAESLAAGPGLTRSAEVLAAWKNSPSHCAALFSPVGHGSAARVDGAAGSYWVLNIAGW